MQKPALSTLSNEALCKLRDEIAALLNSRALDLQRELDRLNGAPSVDGRALSGTTRTRKKNYIKPAPKYRGPDGKTWCGIGARPRWLSNALKEGKTLDEFLIASH